MTIESAPYRALLGTVFLAWTILVLVAFYAVQKPIMPAPAGEPSEVDEIASSFSGAFGQTPGASGLLNAALDLVSAAVITLAAVAAGDRLLQGWSSFKDVPRADRLEWWLLAVGAGFGTLGIGAFLLGICGMANQLALGLACIALPLAANHKCLPRLWRDVVATRSLRIPTLAAFYVAATLSLALLSALMPPTAFDAWLYQLTLPRRALELGRITALHEVIPHEGWPSLVPSLYMVAMSMRGDTAAQLLHYFFGLLTLCLIGLTARRWYGREAASAVVPSIVLTLSMPMFALLATWAYSDIALAFYHVATVYVYWRYAESGSDRYLLLSGALAGCAMGSKYTAFVLPLGIVGHALLHRHRDGVVPMLRFTFVAACVGAPWLLKNWLFYGNPVFPFVFGGSDWDSFRATWYAQAGTGIGLDPFALLSLPIVAMQGYRDANFWDGRFGPLVLIVAPLLVLRNSLGKSAQALRDSALGDPFLFVSALGVLCWIVGVMSSSALWQTRLLLPSLVLAIPALGRAVIDLRVMDLPALSYARVFRVLAGIVLAVGLIRHGIEFAKVNPLGVLAGTETRDAFTERQWQEHVRALRAVNVLPDTARVQFLWEPRTYLARRSVRSDAFLDVLPHQLAVTGSLEGAIASWKAEGITHVLIFDGGARVALRDHLNAYTQADAASLERIRDEFTRVVYQNTAYSLLALK